MRRGIGPGCDCCSREAPQPPATSSLEREEERVEFEEKNKKKCLLLLEHRALICTRRCPRISRLKLGVVVFIAIFLVIFLLLLFLFFSHRVSLFVSTPKAQETGASVVFKLYRKNIRHSQGESGSRMGRNRIGRLPLDIKEKPPLPISQLLSWSLRGGRQKKQHVYGFSLTYPSTNAIHHCIMTQAWIVWQNNAKKQKQKNADLIGKTCAVGRRSMLIQNSDYPWFQDFCFIACIVATMQLDGSTESCVVVATLQWQLLHQDGYGSSTQSVFLGYWYWKQLDMGAKWLHQWLNAVGEQALWSGSSCSSFLTKWAQPLLLLLLILQNPDLGIVVLWTSLEEVLYLFL